MPSNLLVMLLFHIQSRICASLSWYRMSRVSSLPSEIRQVPRSVSYCAAAVRQCSLAAKSGRGATTKSITHISCKIQQLRLYAPTFYDVSTIIRGSSREKRILSSAKYQAYKALRLPDVPERRLLSAGTLLQHSLDRKLRPVVKSCRTQHHHKSRETSQ